MGPSAKHASDHLPLALVIQPSGPASWLGTPRPEEVLTTAKASPFANEEEENKLLTTWNALRAEAPNKPKGKPSPEMIEQLKMQKQREEAFLTGLPEEVAKW